MTNVQMLAFIFDPDPEWFNGGVRWSWIENCLLGDIRTMLAGIEKYQHQKGGRPGEPPLGGGNLSVPILVTTALEFLSRLYQGDTNFARGNYNATKNVLSFIREFFEGASKKIPWLLWKAVRNGLHHNFQPVAAVYEGTEIRFTFLSQDTTSLVCRHPKGILFVISAPDLFNALSDATQRYRERLTTDPELRHRFIKSWGALESHRLELGNKQGEGEPGWLVCNLRVGDGRALFKDCSLRCTWDKNILKVFSPEHEGGAPGPPYAVPALSD